MPHHPLLIQRKLDELCDIEGYEDAIDLAKDSDFGPAIINNAICMENNCDYTAPMEPDQDAGWCPICEKLSVSSVHVLLGVI